MSNGDSTKKSFWLQVRFSRKRVFGRRRYAKFAIPLNSIWPVLITISAVLNDVRSQIEQISSFPPSAEDPEVKLMVRYPENERAKMASFENIRIRDNSGTECPITEVAEIQFNRASSELNRLDQRRSITVIADVDKNIADPVKINYKLRTNIVPAILSQYKEKAGASFAVNWEGEQAETVESMTSMFTGLGIALLCMYVLLTFEFRSYLQPVILMAIIPFGWLGAVIGHAILGIELSLFSFFGLIALTGVDVNDSIVMLDIINQRIRDGMPLREALVVLPPRVDDQFAAVR